MDISSAGSASVSEALQMKSLQLAKGQQEQNGEAALQLIESANTPQLASSGSVGSNINTYA